MINKLIKIGLLLLLIMFVSLIIIWFTDFLDVNGKIGLSVIVVSICFGIAFGCIIRGRQFDQLNKSNSNQDKKTHD